MDEKQKPVKVTVGVCGGIAAYKAVDLVRLLQDAGLDPHVVMTASAQQFVTPLTFSAISGHNVITGMFAGDSDSEAPKQDPTIEHIAEAQSTSALVIAPATASTLAKLAQGIADDFLSTLYLATTAPVIIAPAMNVNMWNHPATQANLAILRERGIHIVEPGSGYLACGMTGSGRLAEVPTIVSATLKAIEDAEAHAQRTADLANQTVLITAGGTREAIDPVRFIGNRSSGRMGYALAAAARQRGARVILISAPTTLTPPQNCELVPVTSAEEMRQAVLERLSEATLVIMAAAVSDFTVANSPNQKIKRNGPITLELQPTADILAEAIARRSPNTLIIGFAAETTDLLQNARAKLQRKGADAIVANLVSADSTAPGFDSDRNAGIFLTPTAEVEIPATTKQLMAHQILDETLKLHPQVYQTTKRIGAGFS
jgi:phosphopantothenoylcysteine decarboxylase/phosphopantothenate--cysteine ligase